MNLYVFDPQITQISADYQKGKRYPCRVVGGTVSEDLFARGLCLPSGTAMSEGDLERIVKAIKSVREKQMRETRDRREKCGKGKGEG